MGETFVASSKAADAPDIEAGFYDAKFDGVSTKFVEGGAYGDGDRFVWAFTLLDDDGEVMYEEGEPIEVDGLTSKSTNVLSKTEPRAVRYLKALLTTEEFNAFKDGKGFDSEALVGRVVQVDIAIRDSGWPTVANVLPQRKKRAGRKSASSEGDA